MRKPPWIYQGSPEEEAEKAAAKRAAKAAERFGVFTWEPENMYRTASARKIYKRRSAAEKFADAENERDPAANLVVRPIR